MNFRRKFIIFVNSIIIAAAYSLAALLTGISNSFVLILSSLFYGIIFYFVINSTMKSDIVIKMLFAVIIGIVIKNKIWDTGFFYRIFVNFNAEYGSPNAGTGFGVVISYIINLLSSILIFLAVLLNKLGKPVETEK